MDSAYDMMRALIEIIVINVVLSGDNAVVIALACRNLQPRHQKQALILGSVGVVVLMVVLTAFASYLMSLPYLEIIGAALLLWIGVKLLLPEDGADKLNESAHLWEAVKTIIIADIVMSLDNVLGMAAAAKGHFGMLIVGLTVSIPLVLFGSAMIVKLMERVPVLVTAGAGLLGYVAGEMGLGDPLIHDWLATNLPVLDTIIPIAGAAGVVGTGKLMAWRANAKAEPAEASPAAEGAPGVVSSGD